MSKRVQLGLLAVVATLAFSVGTQAQTQGDTDECTYCSAVKKLSTLTCNDECDKAGEEDGGGCGKKKKPSCGGCPKAQPVQKDCCALRDRILALRCKDCGPGCKHCKNANKQLAKKKCTVCAVKKQAIAHVTCKDTCKGKRCANCAGLRKAVNALKCPDCSKTAG
ncbi:hypothetical protein ACFL59_05785 [Planctomycetota bacterium]